MNKEEVPSDLWTEVQAEHYDEPTDGPFAPETIERTSSFLAELAGTGPALEFAIGTGRIGIPLSEKGIAVHGIEYSDAMADVLRGKTTRIPVAIGDMATTEIDGDFTLVYLVFNTIGNLYTQEAQVQCFRNAAKHLRPGGRFVIEVGVPPLRSLPLGSPPSPSRSPRSTWGWTHSICRPSARSRTTTSAGMTPRTSTCRTTTGTCGPPNSTSWHSSPGSNSKLDTPTGTAPRSTPRARRTSPCGGSPTSPIDPDAGRPSHPKPR